MGFVFILFSIEDASPLIIPDWHCQPSGTSQPPDRAGNSTNYSRLTDVWVFGVLLVEHTVAQGCYGLYTAGCPLSTLIA